MSHHLVARALISVYLIFRSIFSLSQYAVFSEGQPKGIKDLTRFGFDFFHLLRVSPDAKLRVATIYKTT